MVLIFPFQPRHHDRHMLDSLGFLHLSHWYLKILRPKHAKPNCWNRDDLPSTDLSSIVPPLLCPSLNQSGSLSVRHRDSALSICTCRTSNQCLELGEVQMDCGAATSQTEFVKTLKAFDRALPFTSLPQHRCCETSFATGKANREMARWPGTLTKK